MQNSLEKRSFQQGKVILRQKNQSPSPDFSYLLIGY